MKNKININRKPLTPSDIEKGKNFNALIENYKKATIPFYKRKLFYYSIGVAASLIILFFVFVPQNKQYTPLAQRPFIDPPCKNLQIKFADYIVPAEQGGTYQYKTGSKITVPANAFLSKDGKIVKGDVNLVYREFHDQADIMFSGIPMAYDSIKQLASAGMLEISANQNGNQLQVNPKALINVQMACTDTGSQYNCYYLDTTAKKWVCISKADFIKTDSIKSKSISTQDQAPRKYVMEISDTSSRSIYQDKINHIGAEIKKEQSLLASITPVKPLEPKEAAQDIQRFDIDVDSLQFPEVAVYKKVKFQITGDEKNYDSNLSKIIWTNVTVKKAADASGIYYVTFSRNAGSGDYRNESHTFKTTPVFEGKYYADAKEKFDELNQEYLNKIKDKKLALQRADSLQKLQVLLAKQAALDRAKNAQDYALTYKIDINAQRRVDSITKAQYKAWNNVSKKQSQVTTILTSDRFEVRVMNFGTYNCDHPLDYPEGPKIAARIIDDNHNVIHPYEINLLEKNVNTVYKTYTYDGLTTQFTYSPKNINALWIITSDGRVAIVDETEFKNETKGFGGEMVFHARLIDVSLDDIDKTKDLLYANTFTDNHLLSMK